MKLLHIDNKLQKYTIFSKKEDGIRIFLGISDTIFYNAKYEIFNPVGKRAKQDYFMTNCELVRKINCETVSLNRWSVANDPSRHTDTRCSVKQVLQRNVVYVCAYQVPGPCGVRCRR